MKTKTYTDYIMTVVGKPPVVVTEKETVKIRVIEITVERPAGVYDELLRLLEKLG